MTALTAFDGAVGDHQHQITTRMSIRMRKVLLGAAVAAAVRWWFIGGRELDEQRVRDFYHQQLDATLSRDPDRLCKQLHSDFRGSAVLSAQGNRAVQSLDQEQACNATHQMYENIEAIGEKLGGMATLDYEVDIVSIQLNADRTQAIVETKFRFEIAGAFMELRGATTDTLVRRNGKALLLRSEGVTNVTSG